MASVVLPKLFEAPWVSRVIGVDIRPSPLRHRKYSFVLGDIRDDLTEYLSQCDTLLHLAFQVTPGRSGLSAMYDNNVKGTLNTFYHANNCGVSNIIYLSSVSVYGSGYNLLENTPLRPSPWFPYAEHKAEIEKRIIDSYPSTTILRSHYIVGKHSYPFLSALANSRFYISYSRGAPTWQLVHEDDVSTAIELIAQRPSPGIYNVAAPGSYSLDYLFRREQSLQIPLSIPLIKKCWKAYTLINPMAKAGWLNSAIHLMNTSLTVNCDRIHQLGWCPMYTGSALRSSLFL